MGHDGMITSTTTTTTTSSSSPLHPLQPPLPILNNSQPLEHSTTSLPNAQTQRLAHPSTPHPPFSNPTTAYSDPLLHPHNPLSRFPSNTSTSSRSSYSLSPAVIHGLTLPPSFIPSGGFQDSAPSSVNSESSLGERLVSPSTPLLNLAKVGRKSLVKSMDSAGGHLASHPLSAQPSTSRSQSRTRGVKPQPHKPSATRNGQSLETLTNFLSSVFPNHSTAAVERAELVELMTAFVDDCCIGAIVDSDSGEKVMIVHLPPMMGGGSDLEDDDDDDDDDGTTAPAQTPGIDIRDQLTTLLDLASDSLHATKVILALRRSERDDESLRVLLHSLAYVGGEVLVSPSSVGVKVRGRGGRRMMMGMGNGGWGLGEGWDWEWDEEEWVLVGIEL